MIIRKAFLAFLFLVLSVPCLAEYHDGDAAFKTTEYRSSEPAVFRTTEYRDSEPVKFTTTDARLAWGGSMMVVGGGTPAAGGGPEIIGYDSIGALNFLASSVYIRCSAMDAPSQSGTITKIEIYSASNSATLDVKVGVYQDSSGVPGNIVGSETEFTDVGTWTAEWHEFSPVSISVSAGTNYWLCFHCVAANLTVYDDTLTGTKLVADTHTYADAWPATFTNNLSNATQVSIRATVTP